VASLKERFTLGLGRLRARRPVVDHAMRTQEHYGEVKAGQQAGAVTYFAFLSVFPILALAFFVVGYVARVYPKAQDQVIEAVDQVFPGLIGTDPGQIQLSDVQHAAGAVGLLGLLGLVYSGLGWLSAMRDALIVVFELPARDQPSFVVGKLRDLVTLVIVGLVLVLAVAVSGFVSRFSADVLGWLNLGSELDWLLRLLTLVFGLAANMVLFFALYRLLAGPRTPRRSLWSGALLGAVGFEVLKQISGPLLAATKNQPAFQAFGIALILVVWINYFSRDVLYAAAWAHTSAAARAQRVLEPAAPLQGPPSPSLAERPPVAAATGRPGWARPFAAGAAAALGLLALLRHQREGS
jgi:membrane protein